MRFAPTCLLALAGLLVGPAAAYATVFQSVTANYDDGTVVLTQSDNVEDPLVPGADDIIAQVFGPSGSARGSVGAFGNLGIQGQMSQQGTVSNGVLISNDFVPNTSSIDRQAELRFIIDGGQMLLLANTGSSVTFSLSILGFIFDENDDFFDFINWSTGIQMVENGVFGTDTVVTYSGEDIGATDDGFEVTIPLSFQTVDIGVIPGGGYADFSYSLSMIAEVVGGAEIAGYAFSDPLQVDGFQESPRIFFLDDEVAGDVPAPASLPLMALAVGLIWLRRRTT